MDGDKYLFIDGSYLEAAYERAMQAVFGERGELNIHTIKEEAKAFRAFCYYCPEDVPRHSDTDVEFEARLHAQDQFFARISSLRGVHLRLGTLKGQRRREQKEIDVLLAVDMLEHGLNRNMTHAVLVAGDLDFRPVVEALVRNGVFVEIWYDNASGAKELPLAADFGRELRWIDLWNWSSDSFRSTHLIPHGGNPHEFICRDDLLKEGELKERNVVVATRRSKDSKILRYESSSGPIVFEHRDLDVLTRYFEVRYGTVNWKS